MFQEESLRPLYLEWNSSSGRGHCELNQETCTLVVSISLSVFPPSCHNPVDSSSSAPFSSCSEERKSFRMWLNGTVELDVSVIPFCFRIMEYMSGILGCLLVYYIFTVYVILTQTPLKMRSYANYLLVYQVTEAIVGLGAMSLISPWFSFPILGGFSVGPLYKWWGVTAETQLVFSIIVVGYVYISIGLLFFQRQQSILSDGHPLKFARRTTYKIVLVLSMQPLSWVPMFSYVFRNNNMDELRVISLQQFPQLRNMIMREDFLIIGDHNVPYVAGLVATHMFLSILYVSYCTIPCIIVLRKTSIHRSQKTSRMQKTMLHALMLQTSVPTILLVGPVVFGLCMVMSKNVFWTEHTPWLVFAFSLHGPISTTMILGLYKPYRDYVLFVFRTIIYRSPQGRFEIRKVAAAGGSTNT